MSSSPFAVGVGDGASRPRKGSIGLVQTSALGGPSSTKSTFSRAPLSHAGSPAHIMSTTINGSSPGFGNHNAPSPATFANMAAAVGVHHNTLDDPSRTGGVGVVGSSGRVKAMDPYAEMLSNVGAFLNEKLGQVEAAGKVFYDEYETALDAEADLSRVAGAHQHLMSLLDQLKSSSTQLGIAALPCPASGSSSTASKASTLDEMHSRLMSETKETFERRERLREGTSMVTSILTHDQRRKPG